MSACRNQHAIEVQGRVDATRLLVNEGNMVPLTIKRSKTGTDNGVGAKLKIKISCLIWRTAHETTSFGVRIEGIDPATCHLVG